MEPSYFTINACNRCRRRKAKCDPNIPACAPCQKAGSSCEYTEPRSKKTYPRSFIRGLEEQLSRLETEARSKVGQGRDIADPQRRSRASSTSAGSARPGEQAHPDLIRLDPGEDAHFLGVSSGMHLARSVLESAQRSAAHFDSASHDEQTTTASPSHRRDGQVPSTVLPSRETALHLVEIFFSQYEVQYPILVEHEFMTIFSDFYDRKASGSQSRDDIWIKFMLNMVFAISLVFLSRENPDSLVLAESFSASAMADLSTIMQTKNLQTLQCLLLVLLSSVLDSSSAPIWYISGLCMRMCIDLGLHSETTIKLSGRGQATDGEIDVKRRLFWVTYTFDRTLSTLLGRPFTLADDTIEVNFPSQSLPDAKKPQILHWLKLQRLQSEIVHRLYSMRDETSNVSEDDKDINSWSTKKANQLKAWIHEALTLSDPTGHNIDWWEYWYQNTMLILHRPSPLKPKLHGHEPSTCYEAAKTLIQLSFIRIHKSLMDFTWVDLHYQFLTGITVLFLVWKNAETRSKAKDDWISFKSCLIQWEFVLDRFSHRWDRIARAKEVLIKLANTTMNMIEKELTNNTRGNTEQLQHRIHAADMDHKRSIIRQLGSPRTYNATNLQRNGGQDASSDTLRHQQHYVDRSGGVFHNGSHPGHFECSNSSQPHDHDFQQLPVSPNHLHQAISPQWPADTQAPQQTPSTDLPIPQDLLQMLNEQTWSGYELYDNTMGLPGTLGAFDYFSGPIAGMDDIGIPGAAPYSRPDSFMTNSILNFHGGFDDLGQSMGDEQPPS